MRILFLCWSIVSLCAGCRPSEMTPLELTQWVRDPKNGWSATSVKGDYVFIVLREPLTLKALRVLPKAEWSDSSLSRVIETFSDLEYYTLTMRHKEGIPFLTSISKNRDEYFFYQAYYSDEVRHDISLVTPYDTLYPVICHFERNYEAAEAGIINLAFRAGPSGARELVYSDRMLGIDPVFLSLTCDDRSMPKLIY